VTGPKPEAGSRKPEGCAEKPVIQDDVTGERLLLNKFHAHDPSCWLEFNAEGQIIAHISGQFSGDFDTEEGGPIVMSIGRCVA